MDITVPTFPGLTKWVLTTESRGQEKTGSLTLKLVLGRLTWPIKKVRSRRARTHRDQPAGSSALVFAEDGVIAKLEALTTSSTGAKRDSDIYDSKGQDIGELDETVIDVNRGQVAYILVSHGGFLGMDENLYVTPIEALSISPYRNSHRLTVNAQILEHEPALHVERVRFRRASAPLSWRRCTSVSAFSLIGRRVRRLRLRTRCCVAGGLSSKDHGY